VDNDTNLVLSHLDFAVKTCIASYRVSAIMVYLSGLLDTLGPSRPGRTMFRPGIVVPRDWAKDISHRSTSEIARWNFQISVWADDRQVREPATLR